MQKITYSCSCIVIVILIAATSALTQSRPNNTITGYVFDAVSRNPVPDVYVELMNDVYSTVRRIKTDGSGRYLFNGMSAGEFQVKVLPYGTNYLEEMQSVSIINYTIGNVTTSDNVYLDIYLKLDKRKINIDDLGAAEVIYVQDVPSEARNLYKKGLTQLQRVKDEKLGFENLLKSLEIYPDYYDALNKLGLEYVKRKQYNEAVTYLIRAIKVNQRSFSSFYLLGLSAYNLKQLKESAEAFRAATVINPQSIDAYIKHGMILRIDGKYKESELVLLKAVSLSKNTSVPELSWQLALLYEKLGRYNEAADELEKYMKVNTNIENVQQIKTLIVQMRTKAKATTR